MGDSDETQDHERPTNLSELAAFVERMIAIAQRAGMSSIVVETDDLKLKIKSGTVVETDSGSTRTSASEQVAEAPVQRAPEPEGHVITAPMVGTYYHATSPADPPLVQVGDRVEIGQLIGIIEAMKIMNEITADRAGTVAEVIAANATAVEYGSPLIRLSA